MRNLFRARRDPNRYTGMVRAVRTRERKHMRHSWQWIALGVAVLLLALAAYGAWLYRSTAGKIQERIPPIDKEPRPGRPFVALLVGSDSRAGLTHKEQIDLGAKDVGGGERADTLIVAHVDPATDHVIMVQFPRDLWVPIPGQGHDRVNTALTEGKSELVETVKRITGLSINHYAQINIAGFRDLVDAIDGVDVCVPEPIPFDPHTGIRVRKPGMIHFGGDRALRFVRSRHAFAGGDLARIQNQQKFIAAAIDKITSVSTFLNPGRIKALIDVAGRNLRIDDRTSPLELYHLAQRFRSFDPEHYEAYTVPDLGPATVQGAAVLQPDWRTMRVMFGALARNESPADADGVPGIEPRLINVGVYNGTSVEGAASRAAAKLEAATDVSGGPVSIASANIANADRFGYRRTVIRYAESRPEAAKMAALVGAAVPGARVAAGRTAPGVDVAVIVGRRFETRPITQILPIPIPKPGKLPAVCRQ
jgi:LCP family protein required for cell wall assembly